MISLSVVVSVYNEEEALSFFHDELTRVLSSLHLSFEIIYVNDGSTDRSLDILRSFIAGNEQVIVLDLSRNFGHEAAMIAGIDKSQGESVVCLDADLQHPPRYIIEMLEKRENGYDIINMVRVDREDGGIMKNLSSRLFYWMTNKLLKADLEANASDFFMISKRVAKQLKEQYRERTRFLRGVIQIMGFRRTSLEFVAPERVAGKSKYSLWKLLTLSFSAISTLSKAPLKIALWCGLLFGAFSIIVAIFSLIMWIVNTPFSGYTTIVILVSAMFSVNFIVLGIIGEYIGFLFDESKKRPIYTIMDEYRDEDTTT